MKDDTFYDKYIRMAIKKLSSPKPPSEVWDGIKGAVVAGGTGTLSKRFASLFKWESRLMYIGLAAAIFLAISLFQYSDYRMYNEVNSYLDEYVTYVSTSKSLVDDMDVFNIN